MYIHILRHSYLFLSLSPYLSLYLSLSIYIYIYTYTYIYIYIYIYISMHIYAQCFCNYIKLSIYLSMCLPVYLNLYVFFTHTKTYVCEFVSGRAWEYTQSLSTSIYIYIYNCVFLYSSILKYDFEGRKSSLENSYETHSLNTPHFCQWSWMFFILINFADENLRTNILLISFPWHLFLFDVVSLTFFTPAPHRVAHFD